MKKINNKYNLLELTYKEMENLLYENNITINILDYVYKDIHKYHKSDIEEFTLNKKWRIIFNQLTTIPKLEMAEKQVSKKGDSIKYLFKLFDGEFIESVLIKDKGKLTLCVSSQVGCALGCTFCATGKMAFRRNLEVWELLSQVYEIAKDTGMHINNVVYMGMGEPLLNYENVLKSAYILNSNYGINLGAQKISISTVGIIPMIRKFIKEKHPFHLILSLHSAIQEKREKLIPLSKKFTIDNLIDIIKLYYKERKDWITIAYILIKGFNMGIDDIKALKQVLRPLKIKLNLIPFNQINDSKYESPTSKEVQEFNNSLAELNLPVNIRKTVGQDINGACGQLFINQNLGILKNA